MRTRARLAAAAAVTAALLSCRLFDYSNIKWNKFALVYGVSTYISTTDPYWTHVGADGAINPNLNYPDSDATSIADMLRQQGYSVVCRWIDGNGDEWRSDPSNPNPSTPLSTIASDTTAAQGPSKANIAPDIASLAGSMGSNDVFVFYFSGHGTQDTSTSPPHEFIVPAGSLVWDSSKLERNGTSYGEYAAVESLCVRDDEMGGYLSPIKTPRKVVILDTCNSGGFIGDQLESDWTPPLATSAPAFVGPDTLIEAISNYFSMEASSRGLSPYRATVLSSAGRDESSYETSTWSHGVMTYWLLEGLEGPGDLNKDGHVTALEAFAYTKAGVDQNWNNDAGVIASHYTFEPHVSGGPVDFVLF